MTNSLEPLYAANLASDVYTVKSVVTREDFIEAYKSDFDLPGSKFATGQTGGYILNSKHVMAVLSIGKMRFKGHAFVLIKGTASLYDVLTDLNAGVHSSHTGFPVHQGFYYAFDSILKELKQFVNELNGINVIHCVGHSLGGAIATLAADWLKSNGKVPTVNLYTFGSPRVGLDFFARKCTSKLNSKNIFRVCHRTDPVPMVPTWPFFHVPYTTVGYLIDSPVAIKPWEYHLMKHYIHSAKMAGSWQKIASNRPAGHLDSAVESWLKSNDILSFSANTLELLNAALIYVIKKVIHVTGVAIVTTAAGNLTLLDRMAMFMAKATKVSADLSNWVYHLVKKMAALIGIKVKEGTDLTTEFIRSVFFRLHQKISDMIWRIGQEVG